MKNIILCVVVISALVATGIGGTLAGFVDTEEAPNQYQAGISDLLVNSRNDPNVPMKFNVEHGTPGKSMDMYIDLYNWGVCNGGNVYLLMKDIVNTEAGVKTHNSVNYVFDNAAAGTGDLPLGIPPGYRQAVGAEPKGAGVWSSEPEKIAEVGDGYVGNTYISATDSRLLGEDYADVAAHLSIVTEVPKVGASGDTLGNPDTNNDGQVDGTEYAAWITAGNRWVNIASLSGKLATLITKDFLGFLPTQQMTFVHISVTLQQISAADWSDLQTIWWPTNALQGDKCNWVMLFELLTDDPPK